MQGREARVMTTFLRSKLDDLDTVIPALRGLAVLTSLETFSDDAAVEMIESCVELFS